MGRNGKMDINFYPRSPCGERPKCKKITKQQKNFYPRSPCGERPLQAPPLFYDNNGFYPRSPCGERRVSSAARAAGSMFLSTLSLRRATGNVYQVTTPTQFLSTLSLRRATTVVDTTAQEPRFLSTLSLRRATTVPGTVLQSSGSFYPRSPCGERPGKNLVNGISGIVSIHALLAESDHSLNLPSKPIESFYPRSPCGERQINPAKHTNLACFYPRSPCGERQRFHAADISTRRVSIHALLAESD